MEAQWKNTTANLLMMEKQIRANSEQHAQTTNLKVCLVQFPISDHTAI